MSSLLDIMDRTGTTVQFALEDPNAASSAEYGGVQSHLLGDPNFGAPTRTLDRYAYVQGNGTTLRNVGTLTARSFKVRLKASSYDNLNLAAGRLSALLAQGGVMRWLGDGSSQTRYIDYEPSDTPAILDGRALGLYEVLRLFDTPKGVTIALMTQPYMRGAELDSASNLVENATLLRDLTVNGTPDLWSWTATTNITNQLVSPSLQAYTFDIATTSTRYFKYEGMPVGTLSSGQTWTFSIDVRAFATGTGTAASNARCQVVIRYRNSSGTDIGSDTTSTLAQPLATWGRISVSALAPSTASSARVDIRFTNTSATAVTPNIRNAQMELGAVATPFHIGTETANNDPTASLGRTTLFFNPGDAPTPVTVRLATSGSESDGPHFAVVGVRSAGPIVGANDIVEYMNTRYFLQAESMDNGTGTSALTLAAFSGGSGKTTVFTDNTFTTRISVSLLTLLDALRGGRWLVVARVSTTADPSSFQFNLHYSSSAFGQGDSVVSRTDIAAALDTAAVYEVPLGVMSVPSDAAAVTFAVAATRTAGAGNLRWDLFTLVPADSWASLGTAGTSFGGSLLESDPSIPRVSITAADGSTQVVVDSKGPLPFIAQPGLSVVYTHIGQTQEPNMSTEFGAREVGFVFSPRYYS